MGEYNFDKDYKFNPRIRELIEKRLDKKVSFTHNQIENLIIKVIDGNYNGQLEFNEEDKRKIIFYLSDFSPNKYDRKKLSFLSNFLIKVFDKKEITKFVTDIIDRLYHPGMVIYNIKISNDLITYFASLFPNCIKMHKGIIINSDFLGDVKKIYPEVLFDEKTLEINDEQVIPKIDDFVSKLKKKNGKKITTTVKDGIYIISTELKNKLIIDNLSTFNLKVEDIPIK